MKIFSYFVAAALVFVGSAAYGQSKDSGPSYALQQEITSVPPPLRWRATPPDALEEQRREPSKRNELWSNYLLGRGYNGLSGEMRATCLTGKEKPSTGGKKVDYTIHLAGSSEEFRRSVNMNAGASFGLGTWSTDTSVTYFQSTERSRFVDHMVVRVLVTGPVLSFDNPELTAEARKIKGDTMRFYRKCGNRYVRSLSIGGEFIAVVNIESTSQAERESLRATLTVIAKGYGSASAEYKTAMEKISKSYQKDIRIIRNGLNEALPGDLEIDALIKYSLEFPEKINATNGVPIGLEQTDYRTVDPGLEVFSAQEIVVSRMSDKFGDMFETLGDLKYYARHREAGIFYPPLSDDALRKYSDVLGDAVMKAKLAFNDCAENPATRCSIELFPEADVDAPKPAQKVALNPKIGSAQPVGSAGAGEEKTILVEGEWSAWDNGEGLWWPPTRCCFTIEVSRETGPAELHSYTGPLKFTGPARFSIRIGDSTYEDNRGRGLMGVVY